MLWSSLASCRHSVTAAAGSAGMCSQSCIQYLHNFTLSQHETEIYPRCNEGWLLIAPSALYITGINTSSLHAGPAGSNLICLKLTLLLLTHLDTFLTKSCQMNDMKNANIKAISASGPPSRPPSSEMWSLRQPWTSSKHWNDMTAWGLLMAPSHQYYYDNIISATVISYWDSILSI